MSTRDRRHPTSHERDRDREQLAPFQPLPPALMNPYTPSQPSASVGSAQTRAEAAALAERIVTSMRIGRVGREGRELHMRVTSVHSGDIDVELRHEDGRLHALFRAEASTVPEAERIAAAFSSELAERGINVEQIEVRAQG